jgi:tRNA pseudouridine32 synthase / 23S rRNA pseudouridine746 synthase
MFGVLVVADAAGRVGYLSAFSGQLAGAWDVPAFVPPIFDRAAREAVEPRGAAKIKELTERIEEARASHEWSSVQGELRAVIDRHALEMRLLRERHTKNRAERRARRASLAQSSLATAEALHALDQLSRGDEAERRRTKLAHRAELDRVEKKYTQLSRRLTALERLRRILSQRAAREIFDTYKLTNYLGHPISLRDLFTPATPSAGTGDCAAPKLLTYAREHHLHPLAIAEFWWGPPPAGGGRKQGDYYPACRDKCGPLLPFLLEGLSVAKARRFRPPDLTAEHLDLIAETERWVAINKPPGLLSVPGTDATVTDSVLARLRRRYPRATGPLLVHRLDLETSSLLLAALDAEAHTHLQRQFMRREVEKRYIAWLDGEVATDQGTIDLPLRVDLEQRPRQIVDPIHGKRALTRYEVLERRDGRARIAFYPQTGRTHQLRVHAAHSAGLNAPIAGDRLYGRPGERLLLHAEAIAFRDPTTGERIELTAPAPF